jgi:hypothetical protein
MVRMTKTKTARVSPVWPWLIWFAFAAIWTVGLILPMPGDAPFHGPLHITFKFILHKTIHILAYVCWTVITIRLPVPARYRWLLMYFLMLHACLTELLQLHVSTRSGDLMDVLFDQTGIGLGVLISWKRWTADPPAVQVPEPKDEDVCVPMR